MTLRKKAFSNIVGKEENAGYLPGQTKSTHDYWNSTTTGLSVSWTD